MTIAAEQAKEWRAERRAHRNWNDCLSLGHEPGEAHEVASWWAVKDRSVRSEDWHPDDDRDGDVMESFGGTIFEFEDGSLLLHSDDGLYEEYVVVLRGKKRDLAMRVCGFGQVVPATLPMPIGM